MRTVILLFVLLLFVPIAYSATIYGTIYDLSLEKAQDVRVEIDTEPQQFYVSKNGSYAFNVPNGNYNVIANQYFGGLLRASISENVTIVDEGSYVLDLILFPEVEEQIDDEIDILVPYPEEKFNLILLLVLILFIVAVFILYIKKKNSGKTKYEDADLDQLMEIIKKEGGRTTQKELRKQIPLSEAKISLMISELEHKGKIEKIKKGRGNIIILKKDET